MLMGKCYVTISWKYNITNLRHFIIYARYKPKTLCEPYALFLATAGMLAKQSAQTWIYTFMQSLATNDSEVSEEMSAKLTKSSK